MDIYSADAHLDRVLKFIKEFAESNPSMYEPTRNRLRILEQKASQIVKVTVDLLQDEVIGLDDEEFAQATSDSEIAEFVSSIQAELDRLKLLTSSKTVPVAKPPSTISPATRKRTLFEYGRALKAVAATSTNCEKVDTCASLLWRWFDTRFYVTPQTHPKFKYNIRRIPTWIRDIVVMYGHAVETHTDVKFVEGFVNWCAQLDISEAGDKFAVPYEVYEFNKDHKPSDLTLTAVVIWDVLVGHGLTNICTLDASDLYLDADAVYSLCAELNPSALDPYAHYSIDPGILVRCNLIGGDK